MRTRMQTATTRRLETSEMAVRKSDLRNTAVQRGDLATRPIPAAPLEDIPELDPQQLLRDPQLKGRLAAKLLTLVDEPMFTVEQAARLWQVCEETVRRDIRKGALRAFRLPGGAIRILRSDILAYGRPED